MPTRLARDLIEATVRACFAADLSEVSLLNWLFLVRASNGVESLMSIKGGYQDSQFEGGRRRRAPGHGGRVGRRRGAGLAGHVGEPNRPTPSRVTSRRATVRAGRVVLALPRALTAGIQFDPVLPADHVLLIHQVPAGTEIKMVALYDEPFWRQDGDLGRHRGHRRPD